MDELDDGLHQLVALMLRQKQLLSHSKSKTLTEADCKEFVNGVREYEKLVTQHIKEDLREFVIKRHLKLFALKELMTSSRYTDELAKLLKGIHDRIFIGLKFKQTIKNFQEHITKVFTEFTKGITFFKKEAQYGRWPVYHRNASCGSKQQQSIYRFSKTMFGPELSSQIENCYIERLIYDNIYERLIGYQDLGHSHELHVIERLYDKYFPINNLSIEIAYKQNLPYLLVVHYNATSEAIFTRTFTTAPGAGLLYEPEVHATKKEGDKLFIKQQSYDAEQPWQLTA